MPAGIKVRVVTSDHGIRVQYLPLALASRGKAAQDVAVATDDTAVKIVVVPGSGDPSCRQITKVDSAGNPI